MRVLRATMVGLAVLAAAPAWAADPAAESAPIGAPIDASPVRMAKAVAYAEESDVAADVKQECELDTLLASEVADRSKGLVQLVDGTPDRGTGRVLEIQFTDIVASGNAFIGHRKSTKVKGALFQDGKRVAGFRARNNSMGGVMGGFKGSCSVLRRTVEGIADSVVDWLHAPVDGAVLGD